MPSPPEVPLYDAVTLSNIPVGAIAVAGYVDGRWRTWPDVLSRWPSARHVSISATGRLAADVVDVEADDVTVAGAVEWVDRMHAQGHPAPGVYASLSTWTSELQDALLARWTRSQFRVWTAHWTYRWHRCDHHCDARLRIPVDATQFTDRGLGRDLDVSAALTTFFTSHAQGPSPAGR